MDADPVILSYGDSLVRGSDLAILRSNQWLNDRLISFYLELCQLDKFPGAGLSFVAPEVVQCIKLMAPGELSLVLDPLELATNTALLPLNNNPDPGAAGGSHWSLLVYCAAANTAHHLDSSAGCNASTAAEMARKLGGYFHAAAPAPRVVEVGVAQQTNGHDCGLHCVTNVGHVASLLSSEPGGCKDLATLVRSRPGPPLMERKELLKTIMSMSSSKSI